MTRYRDPIAQWRAAVVVLASALTATVAHTAGGGGVPGPGGWSVVALCLLPVAALARSRAGSGAPGLALAGLLGQGVGHLALSPVTLPPATGRPGITGHHSSASAHLAAGPPAHGSGHELLHGHGVPLLSPTSGWAGTAESLAHPAHLDPLMLLAHIVGAALTAVLVAAAEGVRRVAARLILLGRDLVAPATPWAGTPASARQDAPAPVGRLTGRSLRGPPLSA
ncbi:hypothetical protein [Dietzia sp. DQ12-45-1b]|uniref:hypothetical protein n=1 Tax=Dietzia sp. DQ12-45-1b TaxID=912801 RepID=UPI0012E71FCB|nr:hypothetical protein [Dietzia sp. DQ12-45-1b]QGW26374.1 hypothetical protein GJR88_05126 [Dietzia sp. DQ12-45-1b]